MTEHTSVLWLPDALRDLGANVVELEGWRAAQGNYLWTVPESGFGAFDVDPSCYMIHHTATEAATPVVVSSSGTWSKANVWAGLRRGDRLYQTGGGDPTVVFTSAGPARVSSGYGHWPTALEVFDDIRVPWRQTSPDTDYALNRYAFNVETVALGNGSDIDPGVEELLVQMGALLSVRYGWSPWRTIGHVTWSRRKIDPYWNGQEDRIVTIQDRIAAMIEEDDEMMTLERWATRLRNPIDFDRMADVGIITQTERDYWVTVPTGSDEYQDLRDAIEVRSPLWV